MPNYFSREAELPGLQESKDYHYHQGYLFSAKEKAVISVEIHCRPYLGRCSPSLGGILASENRNLKVHSLPAKVRFPIMDDRFILAFRLSNHLTINESVSGNRDWRGDVLVMRRAVHSNGGRDIVNIRAGHAEKAVIIHLVRQ
ncbi:hypothetical protein AGABI1DRAFT_133479 [Agaricus bisporus var. burnettii JB137-S8]|uniref:Uncharacterized protein n=1 Tax=Agaricus bisporus var. burnettii (strain JB137-S8 / ATCC MYA-4627 / FGSC 10392) TaxID=597362 RepID=K5WUJ7_AGABU|nr:uncharacterized protein AGABI1DRAFT_133479 [Agaricus bisporus var. burnettii JB137-S8]EKM74232.1 hypothetical protein AGABI1DRAFT_133479 [Agaricus bisporus var. burnettii JB137-S8]